VGNDEHVVGRWHPHQLRHAAATISRREGDFEISKTVMGHATDSMTQPIGASPAAIPSRATANASRMSDSANERSIAFTIDARGGGAEGVIRFSCHAGKAGEGTRT